MKNKVNITAHSLSPQGDELITVLATFPRIILAEINTHRMLSKNTSSSRAIPFKKMVESVQNNPFIPIAWQKEHTGMQGTEYAQYPDTEDFKTIWLEARDNAVKSAQLAQTGSVKLTKQLCNRLLEPFMWTTMLITGSREGWNNFFNLRCPQYKIHQGTYKSKKEALKYGLSNGELKNWSDLDWLQNNEGHAEIHIMDLAEKIYDAVNESTPEQLKAGEWHIPFEDKMNEHEIAQLQKSNHPPYYDQKVKISTAMSAHTSYTIVGNEPVKSVEKWIELHDKLIAYDPPHSSPMEHCARAMSDEEYRMFFKGEILHVGCEQELYDDGSYSEDVVIGAQGQGWCNNLKGFIPYRYFIDNGIEL